MKWTLPTRTDPEAALRFDPPRRTTRCAIFCRNCDSFCASRIGRLQRTATLWAAALLVWAWPALAAEAPWTLERCLGYALTNSPDAVIAQKRISAAEAGIMQANAMAWPTLQFQSSYTRTDNPMYVLGSALNQQAFGPALSDFNDLPDVDDLNVKGQVTVPLYAGGAINAGRRAAKAGAQAAKANAEAIRNTLAFETVRAFHTIQKARAFVRAAEAGVNAFEQHLALAQKRFDAGTLLRSEVLDVEVRLAQAREDLARTRNALALAQRALRTLLGIDAGDFDVADTAPEVAAPDSADFSGRAELAAVRHMTAAAEEQTRMAKSGYLPHLAAFGSLDYDKGWKLDGDGESYTAGVLLQWNIFDGRLTRGKVAEAQANVDAALEQERKLKLGLGFEVEQAQLNLREANERLAVTAKAITQAEESVTLTRDRFEQGLAITLQLIDAETALTAARVRRAEAEADQRIAVAALRKALGFEQLSAVTTSH